ncbi:tetratricopeptide repeat protein [Bacteroidota bacterium]
MKQMKFLKIFFVFGLCLLLIKPDLLAQKYGKTPEDSLECIKNISLYREYYKGWQRKNYESEAVYDVIKPWRWVFFNCPMATQNTYINGVKIIEYMIDHAETAEIREKYIDTLMLVYDQRIKYFKNEGQILGRKGVDLYKLRPEAVKEYYSILKKSIELEKKSSIDVVLIYYFRAVIKYVLNGYGEKSLVVEIYDEVSDIVDYNIQHNSKNTKRFETAKVDIDKNFEPFANCEILIDIYSKKFKASPFDTNLLEKITKILDKKDCEDSELFFNVTKNLYSIKPTGKAAYLMGVMNYKKGFNAEAVDYLKDAVEMISDTSDLADAYLLLAESNKQLKQFSKARNYALKTLELRPKEGNAYILIGDMYAESAPDCVENENRRDLESKAPYWIAVDQYKKALDVDISVKEIALKRIEIYSAYFPNNEVLHMNVLEKGNPYTVGCWINETTIIR